MLRKYRNKWLMAIVYGLMFMIMAGGCTKKAMVSENITGMQKEQTASTEGMIGKAGEAGDVIIQDEKVSDEGMFEEAGLKETDSVLRSAELLLEIEDIFFDFDKDIIKPDSRRVLEKNARFLKDNPRIRILIEGYADERGTNEYNLTLGERRAKAVKRYLAALGIEPDRIKIISYGEEKQFCSESNESCWQQNRRGHFVKTD